MKWIFLYIRFIIIQNCNAINFLIFPNIICATEYKVGVPWLWGGGVGRAEAAVTKEEKSAKEAACGRKISTIIALAFKLTLGILFRQLIWT